MKTSDILLSVIFLLTGYHKCRGNTRGGASHFIYHDLKSFCDLPQTVRISLVRIHCLEAILADVHQNVY